MEKDMLQRDLEHIQGAGKALKLSRELALASGSPRRKDLLAQAGITFSIAATNAEELTQNEEPNPEAMVCKNALIKASALASTPNYNTHWVLGSDTTVALNNTIYGKPTDIAHAQRMLRELRGQTHTVYTGCALLCHATNYAAVWCEQAQVTFREYDDATMDAYLRKVPVLDKAGAYAIQEFRDMLVSVIDGSIDCIMGLPVLSVLQQLQTAEAAQATDQAG